MADSRLEMLKQIAAGMAAQFGGSREVVVHDLTRSSIDSSIVHIENGHITGRRLGDGPSAAVLNAVKHQDGPLKDHLAYLIRTDNGRVLKCSTIYINDDQGRPRYILSINYDITNLLALEGSIHSLTSCPQDEACSEAGNPPKKITHDVSELLDELIAESVELVGVPAALMTKEDKIRAINFLNDAGAFLITKSGDKVAKYFGISKYTLYSYVEINK